MMKSAGFLIRFKPYGVWSCKKKISLYFLLVSLIEGVCEQQLSNTLDVSGTVKLGLQTTAQAQLSCEIVMVMMV